MFYELCLKGNLPSLLVIMIPISTAYVIRLYAQEWLWNSLLHNNNFYYCCGFSAFFNAKYAVQFSVVPVIYLLL